MKKLLYLLVTLLLIGCTQTTPVKQEVKTLAIYTGIRGDQEWSERYHKQVASLDYSIIRMADSKQYQALNKTIQKEVTTRKKTQLQQYQALKTKGLQAIKKAGTHFKTYRTQSLVSIRRSDEKVVSYLYDHHIYDGEEHNNKEGICIESRTGKRLSLNDVVAKTKPLKTIIQKEADKYYQNLEVPEIKELSWVLDYNGITFFIEQQSVTLSFKDYPELVKKEYQEIPKCYGMQFHKDENLFINGKKLNVSKIMSEDGEMYEYQVITLDNQKVKTFVQSYRIEPMLLHVNNQDYLYVQNTMDNDYEQISVYQLDQLKFIETITGGLYAKNIENNEEVAECLVLSNPQDFILSRSTDVLGTIGGYRHYYVTTQGHPQAKTAYYLFNTDDYTTLKVKQNVGGELLKDHSQKVLEKGTKVKYLRTDNETFADVKLENGEILRIKVNKEEGMPTINGVNVEDIFEGIHFAG